MRVSFVVLFLHLAKHQSIFGSDKKCNTVNPNTNTSRTIFVTKSKNLGKAYMVYNKLTLACIDYVLFVEETLYKYKGRFMEC